MDMLCENRKILAYIGLGISNYVQIFKKKIPRIAIQCVFLATFTLGLLMPVSLAVSKYKTEQLSGLLAPIGIWLTFLSSMLVYLSLLVKIEQISNLFDYMESVVNQSNNKIPILFKLSSIRAENEIQQQNTFKIIR